MRQILKLAICILILLSGYRNNAQTPMSFANAGLSKTGEKGISANNFWLGAQVGYKFGSSDGFADNLLVSGRLLYDVDLGASKFHLPVMGNISSLRDVFTSSPKTSEDTIKAKVQDLMISAQGINVGLYPYYIAYSNEYFQFTLHGSATWKLNAFKDKKDETQYLDQGRFSLGIEASIGKSGNGKYPLTVSVTPTYTFFDAEKYEKIFGENKRSITSLEITGVVPVGNGVGLLIESIVASKPFSAFRAGIIIAASR